MSTASAPPTSAHQHLATLVGRPAFWAAFVLLIGSLVFARAFWAARQLPPLPVLGQVPDFRFSAEDGQPFGSKELAGTAWVGNFIFTRCPTICPLFTRRMAQVQERTSQLGPALKLLSFTVDPEYDTPARLAEFAQAHQAQPARWRFLTGERAALRATIVDGLKIHMAEDAPEDDLFSYAHGGHFVLVDGQGRIRGYYDSADADALERLVRDSGLLVNRGE